MGRCSRRGLRAREIPHFPTCTWVVDVPVLFVQGAFEARLEYYTELFSLLHKVEQPRMRGNLSREPFPFRARWLKRKLACVV